MKKFLFLLCFFLISFFFLGCTRSRSNITETRDQPTKIRPGTTVEIVFQKELTEKEKEGQMILKEVVQGHPNEGIRKTLDSLIRSGDIFLCFRINRPAERMCISLIKTSGGTILVLVINSDFLLTAERGLLYLVLQHEWEHNKDFFQGRLLRCEEIPVEDFEKSKLARAIWETELKALQAEWNLAQELRRTDLMPEVASYVKKLGEEKGFRKALYGLLLQNKPIEEVKALAPWWKQ